MAFKYLTTAAFFSSELKERSSSSSGKYQPCKESYPLYKPYNSVISFLFSEICSLTSKVPLQNSGFKPKPIKTPIPFFSETAKMFFIGSDSVSCSNSSQEALYASVY